MTTDEQTRAIELLALALDNMRTVRQVLEDALPLYPADAGLVRSLGEAITKMLLAQGIVQGASDNTDGREAGRGGDACVGTDSESHL